MHACPPLTYRADIQSGRGSVQSVVHMALALTIAWATALPAQEDATPAPRVAPAPPPVAADVQTARRLALAERMQAALAIAGISPGREYANRLRGEHYQTWARFFRDQGEQPRRPTEPAMMEEIGKICRLIEAGPTWPIPPLTRVPRAAQAPVPDGVLDEACWSQAPVFTGLYRFDESVPAEAPKTTFRILWDAQNLYFAFDCQDSDVIAPDRPRDDHVYNDDCVEVFILPEFQFRTYWEIVLAPNGSIFDAIQCKDLDMWGMSMDKAADLDGLRVGIKVRGTINQPGDADEGYTVEAAVPFSALPGYTRATPQTGQRIHVMLVRLDRQGKAFTCYAFQPLQAWGHNIWNFAVMELAP